MRDINEREERPLEAPFFLGFLTWIVPLVGLLVGINLIKTKREERNRIQGYKLMIAGIVGCIGHTLMIVFSGGQGSYWFVGPFPLYMIVYGVFIAFMVGNILSLEQMDKRLGLTDEPVKTARVVKENQRIKQTGIGNICPGCKFENEGDSKFCERCGKGLR